mmetsp:Transcript_24706/g.64366  ORF Transcript_24706/g.64366 Transcript_24706/m.64366 type:complete len:419 (-) Transcript_24706:2598-3854(-)|eukprot:CAMPEP_0182945690 /NCGR_PEP_ID=MMETSP0105_2-20130417/55872_1 /TAXON_ID=81532 ORGANISM="Acanthoeca-like sp., Strain 10tr" /NCGR_SAMPLE_ID=MMETSP0105_2 /ASSEMBLY_ACC=CAM_ASM_000205 /LENGTH=418 /DNA_ID=CAMNT_0025085737 /DNA_START=222 /DNA_END=1478 /DNA_ORIENTATION=+
MQGGPSPRGAGMFAVAVTVAVVAASGPGLNHSATPQSGHEGAATNFRKGPIGRTCPPDHSCVIRPPGVAPAGASSEHISCGHGVVTKGGRRLDRIPAKCAACSCVPGEPATERCLFPTVPRSGNTWMRRMLEAATAQPTWTVFKAEHLRHHDDSAISEDHHSKVVYDSRARAFVPPCGVQNECDTVLQKNTTVVIVKSHSPFLMTAESAAYSPTEMAKPRGVVWPEGITADVGIGGTVVMAVRNPLDNYYAWHRYLKGKDKETQTGNFHHYLGRWRRHMTHWKQNAEQHKVPTLVYRYEDLFDDRCRVDVVRGALQLSGLYDELRLDEAAVQAARNFRPTRELESALVRYRAEQEATYTATEEEVMAAMKEPLVVEFGYAGLFRAWLETKREKGAPRRAGILDPIAKQGTRCFLYWGI